MYTDILRGDINFEEQLLGVSKNRPMLVQDSSLNVEVVTSKTTTRCGINFSPEEDKLLIAIWLNTSANPIYGNEQYRTKFYGKVEKYFKDHSTDFTRSISSLTSQWGVINRETTKFCGSLAKIEVKNESGTIKQMKV